MKRTIECSETTQEVKFVPFDQILEAIAKGVETRFVRSVVINIVTVETICIARRMHIPEEEIQEWRSSRCSRSKSSEQTDCSFLQSIVERK